MKRITSQSVGIVQGSRVMFSDFANGGAMWTGHGPRESRHVVSFSQPYVGPPAVMVSISMWDLDQKTNTRADLSAENITAESFHLVFRTWGDTRVARIRADWTAIGAVRDHDDWDVD